MNDSAPDYLPIADHGVIGNLSTAALVGRDGRIDWCCMPSLDSPSVFAALLDHERGGHFLVRPAGECSSRQRYLPGSNVLETRFETAGGHLELTDFMPLQGDLGGRRSENPAPEIYRIVRCEGTEVELTVEWKPRFDYARRAPRLERRSGGFAASAGEWSLSLSGLPRDGVEVAHDAHGPLLRARVRLRGGEQIALVTRFGAAPAAQPLRLALRRLRETLDAWRGWSHVCGPADECAFAGPLHERTVRSALLLKLLAQPDTGAIAAAPTTSLPEAIGGVRNWDYRFSWIRDSVLTAQALFAVGHHWEARDFLQWIEDVSWETGGHGYHLQIVYGLHGETDLQERELPHLEGYRGSRPVRIGNRAARQRQLDVFGELLGAAHEWSRIDGRFIPDLWPFLSAVANHACEQWRLPDQGIWEVRSGPEHFVHSKLMVWVALDRAIQLARRYGLPAPLRRWSRARRAVRSAILSEGFDAEQGAFVRSFGSRDLDASTLLIPVVEFLPADDPRVLGTIDRIMERLMTDGMVYRYRAEDGLPGGEGAFVMCTFWLVDALALAGRKQEAREIFDAMAARANHLGLYPEEIEPGTGEFRGNFPQAFSHVGFINSALYLARLEGRRVPAPAPMGSGPAHGAGRRRG